MNIYKKNTKSTKSLYGVNIDLNIDLNVGNKVIRQSEVASRTKHRVDLITTRNNDF